MVDDEPVLPCVHERVALAPPHVDDLVGDRVPGVETRRDVSVADEERRRPVAEVGLERRARGGHSRVAGDDEHSRRRPRLDRVEGGAERRRTRAQRIADVGGHDVAPQVERLRDDRRALLLLERVRGGREEDAVDGRPVDTLETADRGGHRHGEGVLVPVGHRLLGAAGLAAADDRQRHPQHRDVRAV